MDEITQAARAYADSVYHELAEYYSRECAVKDFAAGYTAGLERAAKAAEDYQPPIEPRALIITSFVERTASHIAALILALAHPPKEAGDAG